MKIQKPFDDENWRQNMHLANTVFETGDFSLSLHHYHLALGIAKQLFKEFRRASPLPDALTPLLVVSYLNLADCWAAKNNYQEQGRYLTEISEFLKECSKGGFNSTALSEQIISGMDQVHVALCCYLQKIGDQPMLEKIEMDFANLSAHYYDQANVIH